MRFISILLFVTLFIISIQSNAEDSKDNVCVKKGQWFSKGDVFSNKDVLHSLSKTKVVLLGEDHDNVEHHRWQLQVISELHALQPDMVLGFESFPRRTQKYLDQWVAGELDEDEFLDAVDWDTIWRFDKNHYFPMFHFARMNNIPMVALNVDRSLVSRVGQEGWDSIPNDQREGLSDPAKPSQEYLEILAQVFSQHMPKHTKGHGEGAEQEQADDEFSEEDLKEIAENPSFKKFMQGQLVWDRAMAEAIHNALKKDKQLMMIGVMGAGHLMNGHGVPHQLGALGEKNIKTLMAWDNTLDCDELKKGAVDIAFGISVFTPEFNANGADKPRLGVYLEHDDGVVVSKIVEKSVAEKTGIQVKDKIVNVAGISVKQVSDVVKAVQATAFGTWLPIVVNRDGKDIELVAKFSPKE